MERCTIDTHNTQMYDGSLFGLGTDTSVKRGGVKLVLWSKSSPLISLGFGMDVNA